MGHNQLNREKREILERLLRQNWSIRNIAGVLGYSPSGISQEIKRNSAYFNGKLVYRHNVAQKKTEYRRKRYGGKTCLPEKVVRYVADNLKQRWSPEQIQGRLAVDYPGDPRLRISFKTIYRWIQKSRYSRSPLGSKTLYTKYLRIKRAGKRMRPKGPETRGCRRNLPSIENRPEEANNKVEFGHWEGDLVLGFRGKDNVVTLVEMSTGFLIATHCRNKQKEVVSDSIIQSLKSVDKEFIKTLTFDRGSEFSAYKKVEKQFECNVYFCHPQTPNERALNEQTNGLLRQFYPKRKTSTFEDPVKLKWAVDLINNRPRKKFGYRTTREIIEERGLAKVLSLV